MLASRVSLEESGSDRGGWGGEQRSPSWHPWNEVGLSGSVSPSSGVQFGSEDQEGDAKSKKTIVPPPKQVQAGLKDSVRWDI